MKEIDSLDEIPVFADEDEESDFWDTHSFGSGLLEQAGEPVRFNRVPERRERRRKVEVDASLVRRLERAAKRRGVSTEELVAELLAQGLRSEGEETAR